MERMKNVYKVTVKTENGGICEKFIFTHSPDNAARKMRVNVERTGKRVGSILKIELFLKNVIF
ncbi:hypothetical protein [Eubacterium ramulus]|nr:MAG TPA: hypothetical protein [Caudoviricetes sp.]